MLNKSDYIEEVNNITEKGNEQGKYIETIYTTYNDFKHFQNFLYRSFKKSEYCDQMRQNSNQPGRFFQTAKRHKFPSLNDIIIGNLKLGPVIDLKDTSMTIFKESIHRLRHLEVTGLTLEFRHRC